VRAHDRPIDPAQRRVVEAQLRRHVAAQIAGHRMRRRHQVVEHGAPFRAPDVERHALLAAVEAVEKEAVVRTEEMRSHVARHVAAVGGVLDLDHLGAQIGEKLRAERTGAVLLHREHPHPLERQHAGGAPRSSPQAG